MKISDNRFFVYFRRGTAGIVDAREALAIHDLSAAEVGDESFSVVAEGLSFQVWLDESAQAADQAKIAAEDSGIAALAACDTRFLVEVADLPAALDEINTMMELQGALQDACNGFLVLAWNGGVVEPWDVSS